jgi:hypothetical protein
LSGTHEKNKECFVNNEDGISEVLDETLILALVVITAAVVGVMLLGLVVPIEQTAYVVPQFGTKDISGKIVITAFSRGGDPLYFNATPLAKYRAVFYVDTSAGSFRADPAPSLTVFKPGDTIYLYYTGTRFVATKTLTGIPPATLPSGRVVVRLVDVNSGTLISQETVVKGLEVPLPTMTVTPTASPNATSTLTTAPTPTATITATATITPTATATTGPLVAGFSWVAKGLGGDVHFTDTSTGSPTSWSWKICGSATSTNQNPVKNIGKSTTCTVVLTVTRSSDGATSTISQTVTTP